MKKLDTEELTVDKSEVKPKKEAAFYYSNSLLKKKVAKKPVCKTLVFVWPIKSSNWHEISDARKQKLEQNKVLEEFNDIDIVGLERPDDFFDGISRKTVDITLFELIKKVKPEQIIFSGPSDLLHHSFNAEVDMSTKPRIIYNRVLKFRKAIDAVQSDVDSIKRVLFNHINLRFHPKSKNLLDLVGSNKTKSVTDDLLSDAYRTRFFDCVDITNKFEGRLQTHLGTGSVEEFYDVYGKIAEIGEKEFIWNSKIHVYDHRKDDIKYLRHLDSDMYIWIGDKTAKIVWKELNGGQRVRKVSRYSHERISSKYGKEFLSEIQEFDGLTTEPNNFTYQQIHYIEQGGQEYKYYNMYQPLTHDPKPGDYSNTLKYLTHLFPGKGTIENPIEGDSFSLIIDYLTILYQKPKINLPVIGLISPEQQTGKTTFMDWLGAIYGTNQANMTIDDYLGKFNSHSSFKLVICIDEFEEKAMDQPHAKNKFKNQATAKNSLVEYKGIDKDPVPNYAKVVFATNSEKPLSLEPEDVNRFWIHRVYPFKGERDPNLLDKMIEEIPAFLDFLKNRKIFHPAKSRMWFDPDLFFTEYFQSIVEKTKPYHVEEVENWVKNTFLTYKIAQICISPEWLIEMLHQGKSRPKYNLTAKQVKEVFKLHGYEKSVKNGSMQIPCGFSTDVGSTELKVKFYETEYGKPRGRYFALNAEDWLNQEELKEMKDPLDLKDDKNQEEQKQVVF